MRNTKLHTNRKTKRSTHDPAAEIRKVHSLLIGFLQAKQEYGEGSVEAKRLQDEALLYRKKLGFLLSSARQWFETSQEWHEWLTNQCLINDSLAFHYICSSSDHNEC